MEDNKLSILSAKKDDRGRCNGWAPGNYTNICMDCKKLFVGDKRAVQCADCAYKKSL